MSSPVKISFESFVKIDRRKKEAIYMQIVYQFINAVKSKLLEDDDQLPGSRKIAEELQVHRKTIIAALEELQEQGWVKTLPNVGTFVKNPEISPDQASKMKVFQHPPEEAPFYFRKEFILDSPLEESLTTLYFTEGTPDYRVINTEELVRFYSAVLRRKKQASTLLHTSDGQLFFRDQLSYYLNLTRGFHLSRNFLLPVTGLEQVHSILSRLLINSGNVVLVEEFSYFLPNMIFNQAGAQMKTVPVDAHGMDIDYIKTHFKPSEIRFVYLNTKCQYPTTVSLSEKRKTQLLELAEAYNFIVIENDTDFEFSLVKNKKESLFSKNGGNRVIYIGTFGRFLNPGFQMNFLIAPKNLLQEATKYLNIFGKPDVMMEKALGELIHQGDIHRYQRKSKKVITERKELFAHLLQTYFKDQIEFTIPDSGLAFWIRFQGFVSLNRLQDKTKEKGVLIPSVCLYQNRKIIALRLGFAHLNPQEMEAAVKLLAESYTEVID
ncbi:PLP-dependent aminotransferase family protein [Aequorivita marina]|uniref:aminotransferase-like domain-containing protein n=1 Tax=Aequorivita marina TaxID=3073654 RepID=UPI0028765C2B|nr:PLP-dependent aminotransferase family protein [Aequorivita sp. S2608]MDS1297967.1 PLP-dependent aminotransferase family protein [Aequorivita sp. S2608]